MRSLYLTLIVLCALWGCKNIEDAKPSDRANFIRTYEGPLSYNAMGMEKTSDGYVIIGTMEVREDSVVTVAIKTDNSGNQIGSTAYFTTGRGKAIKPFSNSTFSGYIIVGDSIKIDPLATQAGNIEVSSMHLIFINENLEEVGTLSIKDESSNVVKTDYRGSSLTVTEDGRVIILGTYEEDNKPQKPFILALNKDLTTDWTDKYSILDLDYINAKSIHYNNGKIIWASSILKQQGNFNESYISIPYIQEPLSFDNYSILGENKTRAFFVNDIKPASVSSFGYGVVGTNGKSDGTGKNVFFTSVNASGSIVKEDTLYIDAQLSKTLSFTSATEDTGDALCSTSDGGFIIAGSTLNRETATRDVLLIKVDAFQNIVWMKTLGGSGDETVSAVMETEDKGFLISGTNTIGGYSSIFLIKTNSSGDLIN